MKFMVLIILGVMLVGCCCVSKEITKKQTPYEECWRWCFKELNSNLEDYGRDCRSLREQKEMQDFIEVGNKNLCQYYCDENGKIKFPKK